MQNITIVRENINVKLFYSIWRYVQPMISRAHLHDQIQYIAKIDGKPVGFVQIDEEDGSSIQVCVLPDLHKQGIGRKLVDTVIRNHNHSFITWYCYNANYPSICMLEKLGGGIHDVSNEYYYIGYFLTGKAPSLEAEERSSNIHLHRNTLQRLKATVKNEYEDWYEEFKTREFKMVRSIKPYEKKT